VQTALEDKPTRRICVGLLAHVDAGKTTLSEALLYTGGVLRRAGRVDHGDAFLDTDAQERERGITIFAKQALLPLPGAELTLLDTPGHVDFSAEMERTLQVLDCAVLVISGTDGIQGHTRTLWTLLERYRVPTFLFVNKMDLAGADRAALLTQLQSRLSGGCIDFGGSRAARDEDAAMCDEDALETFLSAGALSDETITALIAARKIFPCWFGSALKLEGIEAFLSGLAALAPAPAWPEAFGARVFKISRDSRNARLTWMKVTGGLLRVRDSLSGETEDGAWSEKADQLRLYSGEKYQTPAAVFPGQVAAVTGLTKTRPGMGLGYEADAQEPLLEPVLNYRLVLPEGVDPHAFLPKLRQLEEEDPLLRIVWNDAAAEIHVRLMGAVQLEVLQRLIRDRFDLDVSFDAGSIVYRETIENTVEGIGHFEPLRHYAEVHLLLEPGAPGSGLEVGSACSTDDLDLNWQRLILTHLLEREHPGVLTGSSVTDLKITLLAGRAHLAHTEGGDFRQATYRAVRQGLMQARSVLLEPFYDFRLELPPACVGRAITDLQNMGGTVDSPETDGELTVLTGSAPVSGLQNYRQEVSAYTRGLGQLLCTFRGYAPCHNAAEVIAAAAYDPERDADNPADSVFCAHGAGFIVKWDRVRDYAHIDTGLRLDAPEPTPSGNGAPADAPVRAAYTGSLEQDKELLAIFERTYGKVEPRMFQTRQKSEPAGLSAAHYAIREQYTGPEYLLVDGYNIIFAWDDLKKIAEQDISAARTALEEILINYQGFRKNRVILVFDAYKVKGNPGSVEKHGGIHVVYTKEAETADTYIEKATYRLAKDNRVRVATSDGLEQVIILGHGANRISADAFREEVQAARIQIRELIRDLNRQSRASDKLRDTATIRYPENGGAS